MCTYFKGMILGALLSCCFPVSASQIDKVAEKKLSEHGLTPSGICSDEVFIRRAFLVTTATIPSRNQVEAFLKNNDPQKREKLADSLVHSESWVDVMVMKWGDLLRIKSEFPSKVWPNGVQAYNRFLRERFRQDMPYDQFARELLTGTGSDFRQPAVNFYRVCTTRKPEAYAQHAALVFMGQRTWPREWEAVFSQIKYKSSLEWKEEFLYIDIDRKAPQPLRVAVDEVVRFERGKDFRVPFAKWFTSPSNHRFAEAFVNRVWAQLMGRGIVHEPDDWREDNAPSNPQLLELLASGFEQSGYNIRKLYTDILCSHTFQRAGAQDGNREDQTLFSHYRPWRMSAEMIQDAIFDITGNYDVFSSRAPEPYTKYPRGTRSTQIGDGTVTTSQLDLLGRPSRDVSLESARPSHYNFKQLLFLANSQPVISKIRRNRSLTPVLYDPNLSREELTDILYMSVLSRHATPEERRTVAQTGEKMHPTDFAETVTLALLNSPEFLFIH